MAKPRVFVSSTYYDLKYVRERLERLISSYCFEPILFESDDVFFNPNIKLDKSCYREVENCHMMLLIVGGRYGSLASEQKDKYEENYISITQNEYETARKKGIPVMVFVEQSVYTEYKTYLANKKTIPDNFNYAFVDDIRVFHFISKLEQGAIKVFNKVDDIEHYFSHQIAGMMLTYLKQLQEDKNDTEVKNAVDEIKLVSQSMQQMINSIGEKVFESERDKYEKLLTQQNHDLIDFFIKLLNQNITTNLLSISVRNNKKQTLAKAICETIMSSIFNENMLNQIEIHKNVIARLTKIKLLQEECSTKISKLHEGLEFTIDLFSITKQLQQILNLITTDKELNTYFQDKLMSAMRIRVGIFVP
jgi:hypothetical protein